MNYVEEADELRAELAVCRETNRRIHEQDAANVAKLQAIRAEVETWRGFPSMAGVILAILDGGGPA